MGAGDSLKVLAAGLELGLSGGDPFRPKTQAHRFAALGVTQTPERESEFAGAALAGRLYARFSGEEIEAIGDEEEEETEEPEDVVTVDATCSEVLDEGDR